MQALAEEGAGGAATVPVGAGAEERPGPARAEPGHGERPPQWQPGLGEEALCGLYREVFRVVAAAPEPLSGAELTRRPTADLASPGDAQSDSDRYAL